MENNWNKNKGLRAIVTDSNQVDVHVIGVAVEANDPSSPPVSPQKFNYFTMHYVLEGHGWLEQGGERRDIVTGDVFVAFPGAKITYSQDETDSWTIGWFTFDGMKAAQYLERAGITPASPVLHIGESKLLRHIFVTTPYDVEKKPNNSDVIALSAFYQIFTALTAFADSGERIRLHRTEQKHVSDAIIYVEENFADPNLKLETVANALGVTSKYLSAIFKRVTGQTFNKFVTNKRISIANNLIEDGWTSVADIAYACGFKSPYYFSNVFRRYNRDSPKIKIKRASPGETIPRPKRRNNTPTAKR